MKLGLINSAWVQVQQPTAFGLRKTKEIGFDTVDIFVDPLELDVRERRLIKDECERLQLPIVSLACVAVGLIDFNGSVRKFHVDRVRAYLDLAYEYQARNVLLVIGEYIWNREVIPAAEQWKMGVEAVRELGRRASDLGLEIVLELEPFPLSLINTVDTMVQFLDDVDLAPVKANIDISHLVLSHVAPKNCGSCAAAPGTYTSRIATAKSTAICLLAAASCRSSPICGRSRRWASTEPFRSSWNTRPSRPASSNGSKRRIVRPPG